jgi:hypothetical protein
VRVDVGVDDSGGLKKSVHKTGNKVVEVWLTCAVVDVVEMTDELLVVKGVEEDDEEEEEDVREGIDDEVVAEGYFVSWEVFGPNRSTYRAGLQKM